MFKGAQLPAARGTLGIATVGDALHKLIPATTPAPCSVKEVSHLKHTPALVLCDIFYSLLKSSDTRQQLGPAGLVAALPLPGRL